MKTFLKITLVTSIVFVGLYVLAHFSIKNKIESALEKPIMSGITTYQDLDLNLFRGSAEIKTLHWKSTKNESNIKASQLKISNLSYYALVLKDHIKISDIYVDEPQISIHKITDSVPKPSDKDKKDFKKEISIENIELNKGRFTLKQDSLEKLSLSEFNFKLTKMISNQLIREGEIPFQYKDYEFDASNLFFDMNTLQELEVGKLNVSDKNIAMQKLYMKPKYTKEKYIAHIPYEKDWMDLQIDELKIEDYKLTLKKPKSFTAHLLEIKNLNFDIFRDKTVKDDVRKKDMYSKMLRDLDFGIKVDSISIVSSYLVYGEQIQKPGPPATIFFDNFNASVNHVTNLGLNNKDFPLTQVKINTQFMGKSKLNFDWRFRVNDTLDRFTVRGSGYHIPDASINSFFTPAFNIEAEGGVEEVFYNFAGDRNVASGDIKLEYQKFKLHILKKDRKRKNKILSFLANIVVKNSSPDGGVSQHVGQVKRDKTKSFWNYFWSCLEAGLKKILI